MRRSKGFNRLVQKLRLLESDLELPQNVQRDAYNLRVYLHALRAAQFSGLPETARAFACEARVRARRLKGLL